MKYLFTAALLTAVTFASTGPWVDPCTFEFQYGEATEDWSLNDECWLNQEEGVWWNHPCIGKAPEDYENGNWEDWY